MSESSSKPTINTRMPKGAKRPKTSRACLACRKLKARCEPAGGTKAAPSDDPQPSSLSFVICHRCKTLCIDCLYETPAGEVVKGEDVQPAISSPSPAEEHNRAPRSSKRSRPEDAPSSDPFSNDRAVFLSPAISPSSLTRSIYRDVDICSLNTLQPAYLERPVLPANALSRLIGANPALKRDAQDYILNLSGAFGSGSTHSWKQAPPDLCAGKAAARLMAGHAPLPAYPHDELEYLGRILQPHEHQLRILFYGLYGAFSPFLSTPFEDSLVLSNAQSEAQSFVLLTIYLAAFPHLEASQPIAQAKAPLRKAIDALLRRAIQSPQSDHLNIFALHNCATFLLLPVDGLAENCRPISTPEQEVDGLLEFAPDLNPRATIITALIVAQRLGYASLAARLPSLRQSFDVDSPQNGYSGDPTRDEYAHAVLCTFTWLTLLQFRASIDVAEDRVEWDSLAQFERDIPRVRIDAMTAALQPPPAFLSPREQSRCCWMAQRAELYGIARDHRHTKRAAASFTKKEAEDQAMGYKKALDEWRYKFGEQMRSMSTEFRKDPRGLGLHRFYSIFSNAEAASLQVAIGSVYHKEFVADMRQRLAEPFFSDGLPWKSAATILLGHEEDQLTKAILINFAFTDAMLKAMGLISSLTPVMPQLYDFVSYEESAGSEIPSLCIVAPPNLQAGLFAVPLLAAADLRLSVIETWGASASYFNHHVMPLLTNCVKSLRACHVNVDLPGVLKIPFATANPIADYLQGPFEILMRKVASAEERLQISHVESILNNSFLLSSKKKQIETVAEELAPDVPEMVQAIADSKKIEDEISAAMMGALNVQSIREIQDTDFAVKVFGSDLREGDVKAIRKPGRNGSSSATTPDAENHRRGPSNARSSSVESEQTGSPSVLTHSSKQRTPMHRSVRSVANASQYSSPSSSTQSGNAAPPDSAVVYHKDPAVPPQGLEQTPAMGYAPPPTAYEASVLQPPSQPHEQALTSSYAPISQTTHAGPTYAPAYAERSIDAPHGYSGSASGVHGMDAYASYPNERYPAESVLGLEAGHAGAAGTAGTGSADVYAYRSDGDHVPAPMHAAGYDGMQRQGAKAEGAGYEGYANVPQEQPQVSEPWQQQQHTQQPQGYGDAYGGDAASGQAYYGQQVSEQQYAEPYAPVYDQAHYQVGQGQHPVAQGQHGSTIWDAWNWTPGQDQPPHHQHPHQQHGHHQQQHQPHPHQQGQHHHHQQYRN